MPAMSSGAAAIFLVGRVVFCSFFVIAGYTHVRGRPMLVAYARSAGFPVPYLARWPAGAWLWVASASVVLGIWPDIGSLMMAIFVVVTALYFHRFWEVEDSLQRRMQNQLFYRNLVALGGSLVMFAAFVSVGEDLRFTLTPPFFTL